MEKPVFLCCVMILINSSYFLVSECRLIRKLNANPQDALGFYGNPYITPDLKRFLSTLIPYIPNPPFDPIFPPNSTNELPSTNFPTPGSNPNSNPNPNPKPTPANPTSVPSTTPRGTHPNPTPANPIAVSPTTPSPPSSGSTPSPPSSGDGNDGNVPIVYWGSGGRRSSNGNSYSWWYKIDANGNVQTSSNFFRDPNVPDFLKQLVLNVFWGLKHGVHP